MTEQEYAEKILKFAQKEKALVFVTDNFYDDQALQNEEHPNYKQSKFIGDAIRNSEELLSLKEEVLQYIESYNEEENEEDYFAKIEPVDDEESKSLLENFKLDWFNE